MFGMSLRFMAVVALVFAALPVLSAAADTVPRREGNIWGGRNHEPVAPDVQRSEQAAGVAPSPRQQKSDDDEVENIYRQVLRNSSPQRH